MSNYIVVETVPSVDDYLNIRKHTLGEKKREDAINGLAGTWFGVHVLDNDKTIGMGRIIGDGGLTFHVTDIAILPEYQGKGIGKLIMKSLMEYYVANGPSDGYMSLIADGNAKYLYEKYGFEASDASAGMLFNKDLVKN